MCPICDFESAFSRIPRVRETSFVFPRRVPLLVVDGKLCASLRERVSIPLDVEMANLLGLG